MLTPSMYVYRFSMFLACLCSVYIVTLGIKMLTPSMYVPFFDVLGLLVLRIHRNPRRDTNLLARTLKKSVETSYSRFSVVSHELVGSIDCWIGYDSCLAHLYNWLAYPITDPVGIYFVDHDHNSHRTMCDCACVLGRDVSVRSAWENKPCYSQPSKNGRPRNPNPLLHC